MVMPLTEDFEGNVQVGGGRGGGSGARIACLLHRTESFAGGASRPVPAPYPCPPLALPPHPMPPTQPRGGVPLSGRWCCSRRGALCSRATLWWLCLTSRTSPGRAASRSPAATAAAAAARTAAAAAAAPARLVGAASAAAAAARAAVPAPVTAARAAAAEAGRQLQQRPQPARAPAPPRPRLPRRRPRLHQQRRPSGREPPAARPFDTLGPAYAVHRPSGRAWQPFSRPPARRRACSLAPSGRRRPLCNVARSLGTCLPVTAKAPPPVARNPAF